MIFAIAKCERGHIGVITSPRRHFIRTSKEPVLFGDAYIGRTISPWWRIGRRWHSYEPEVIFPRDALG